MDAFAFGAELAGLAALAAAATMKPVGLGVDAGAIAALQTVWTAAFPLDTALGDLACRAALTAVVRISLDVDAAVEAVGSGGSALGHAAPLLADFAARTNPTALAAVTHVGAHIDAVPAAESAVIGATTGAIEAGLSELTALIAAAAVEDIRQRIDARLSAATGEQRIAAIAGSALTIATGCRALAFVAAGAAVVGIDVEIPAHADADLLASRAGHTRAKDALGAGFTVAIFFASCRAT